MEHYGALRNMMAFYGEYGNVEGLTNYHSAAIKKRGGEKGEEKNVT